MKKHASSLGQLFIEIVGLSSRRGRLIFFIILSIVIFVVPAKWPFTFSLWQRLGIASPSIGLTRAYRLLLHGDFALAWQQNKLIYAVVAIGGALLVKDATTLIRDHTKKVAPAKHAHSRSD